LFRVKELKGERDRRVVGSDTNTLDENNLMHQRQLSSSEEYPNEDEYPDEFAESDDPELYNDVEDDDLLLHDEDFPSDGDVNILDGDFPHEINTSNNRFIDNQQQQYAQQQQHRGYEPSPPLAASPASTTARMAPVSEVKYNRHPLDMPTMASSPDYNYEQPKAEEPPASTTNDFTTQLEDCLFFDPSTIDSFIKFHRAQIREVTEFSKKETKLLANFSLGLSSRREDERQSSSLREELKTSSEFIGYLDNLDEVLEMKTAAIEALRDRIRHVLGEEEL
jgi:hypothetical protein